MQLTSYEYIPHGNSCSSKGGLIIYLHKRFDYTYTKKLIWYKTWEVQYIQIKKGEHLAKPIMIGNIYRLPRELVENYTEFLNEFTPVIAGQEKNQNEVIINGYFNADLLKINEKNQVVEYFDMFTNYTFYHKVTLPIRFSNKHGTLIDNIFCKLSKSTIDTTSGILLKTFSNHQPYFTVLNDFTLKESPVTYIKITNKL